jgi:hypothetical protein
MLGTPIVRLVNPWVWGGLWDRVVGVPGAFACTEKSYLHIPSSQAP